MFWSFLLGSLALVSCGITLWQWWVAARFPLHQRVTDTSFTPAVTLLKPLKGCEPDTAQCLRSWLNQDYPGATQILFGVDSADDPVCPVVRALLAAQPRLDAQLVICAEVLGPNKKVSTLVQLDRLVRHELVIVSDADVRVPPDFLTNVVAPLRDPTVGLVNCFYRLANPTTPALELEAVAINADFWSQVLQSQSLKPLDFALGAVMATRREQLTAIGGFSSLLEQLADDYQLGHRIARTGRRIALSPVVVECWSAPLSGRQVWAHQVRWARTIRVCQPGPYFLSLLSNATLWPLLWLVLRPVWNFTSTTISPDAPDAAYVVVRHFSFNVVPLAVAVCLLVRIATAQHHRQRLENGRRFFAGWWRPVVKDLWQVAIWATAFLGNRVVWGGRRYRVLAGGKLVAD